MLSWSGASSWPSRTGSESPKCKSLGVKAVPGVTIGCAPDQQLGAADDAEPANSETGTRPFGQSGAVSDGPIVEPAGVVGSVVAVHRSRDHSFSKARTDVVTLVAGMGVEGDAHYGARVKHRGRVKTDPEQPNLRQVHLMHRELFDDLALVGFLVGPGDLGENITTEGIDLLELPVGAALRLGSEALIVITGLRNPCKQIDDFQLGLMTEVVDKTDSGELVRKAGVMAVVVQSGDVRSSDQIHVSFPPPPLRALHPV